MPITNLHDVRFQCDYCKNEADVTLIPANEDNADHLPPGWALGPSKQAKPYLLYGTTVYSRTLIACANDDCQKQLDRDVITRS